MKEKMWAILVHLSMNQFGDNAKPKRPFDVDAAMWDYIVEESARTGLNTIVLDVGDAIQYDSHPEISLAGAWSKDKMRAEIARCRELGLTIIPKLNFSTAHNAWLGDYARMVSSSAYYQLCEDLIAEVHELFGKQQYFHIGMDEESEQFFRHRQYCMYRQGELYWHDLLHLVNFVKSLGAIPWAWSSPLFDFPEEYMARLAPEDMVISPYYYNAFRKEHWTPVESRSEYMVYYNEGEYAKMGIKFVEEDPFLVNVRNVAVPLSQKGHKYIPCASVFNRCDYNHDDLLEYFRDNVADEQILGYITAPWMATNYEKPDNLRFYQETFAFFKAAREKFYAD